jgi:hypothetical protein
MSSIEQREGALAKGRRPQTGPEMATGDRESRNRETRFKGRVSGSPDPPGKLTFR